MKMTVEDDVREIMTALIVMQAVYPQNGLDCLVIQPARLPDKRRGG